MARPLCAAEQSSSMVDDADREQALYADLSRLNNELTRIERRLKKSNAQLDQANRELQALYESLPVGIFRADATGTIEHANERFCTLTGVASAADWLSRVHREDAQSMVQRWRETIRRGVPFEGVHRHVGDDRLVRHVEIKAVPLRDESGGLASIVGVATDVTERVVAEAQQREIERQKALGQLTAGLAHNLNNILMVILNSAEQLCEELPPGHALLAAARRNMAATERAALLTRRLLIYAGHGGLVSGRLDVDAAMEAICHDLGAALPASHALSVTLGAGGAAIGINKVLLAETLQELVTNAQTAMPDGGTIRIATTLSDDATSGRRTAVISVSDTGIGMDEQALHRATEPFFTTREIGHSIGLGLSLADGAARIAGGVLVLRSEPGKGTTAELRLPVRQ